MTKQARKWWPMAVALGLVFILLNLYELVFADGGWPQIVGVPIGMVRSRIHRARLELKEFLEPDFGNQFPPGASNR